MKTTGTTGSTPALGVDPQDVLKVLGRHMLVDGFHLIVDLERSEGSRILDASTNKWYLDFYTFFASSPVGMNHPKIRSEEFRRRVMPATLHKPANSDVYTTAMAEFVQTLEETAMPEALPYLFMIEGGALGVENALKAAFDWKVRKNLARGAKKETGTKVIHFRQAFHGRTGYTLSLTNSAPVKTDYFPKFDWPRIDNPKIAFPLEGENLRQVEEAEARAVEQIEEVFRRERDDIAALIIEPIQGEGGDNHFRGEFFRELRRLCDENETLFVLDEVQTGVGLTGRMWAYQHFGIEPDILCFGKKLQVCGIMASRRLDEVPENVFKVSGRINSTWGGNLADMIRGACYLEIIREEKLVEHAARMGEVLLGGLKALQAKYEGRVLNARGRGLMCAFDLDSPETRDRLKEKCWDHGLLMLPSGHAGIRFRPALNVPREIIEEGLALLDRSLADVAG